MSRLISRVLLIVIFSSLVVRAQDVVRYDDEAEKIFLDGLQRFALQDYAGAYSTFSDVLSRYPSSQRVSASYLMGAKSLFHLQRYDESIQLIRTFLKAYPQSRYLADAHFTLALNLYLDRRYEEAAGEFVKVLESSKEKILLEKAAPLLETICDENLDGVMLSRLSNGAVGAETKSLLGLKLAGKRAGAGREDEARTILAPLIQRYPNSTYAGRARDLLKEFEKKPAVKIGAILPLLSQSPDAREKAIGAEMLQGIEFAIEESRASLGVSADLKVLDSEGDPIRAANAVRTFAKDREIIAILGPVYSAEVSASAKAASDSGVPLITPTANANGLSSVGPFIFQANPDYELRGRAMARFAVQRLGLRTFSVLAPSDSYGKFMADSFLDELGRLGGKVIGVEWYQRGTTDLQDQFMRLRRAARLEIAEPMVSFAGKVGPREVKQFTARGVPRQLLDSLIANRGKIRLSALFWSEGEAIADSLGIPLMKEVPEPDSLEVPIKIIDGLYLPIGSAEEIGILSSQAAFYNFKTQLLGTGDWYNPVELDANRRYTDGVIFDSDTYADVSDSTYLKFFDNFYQKTNTRPTKNTLFGYDSAMLLLSRIEHGAVTREKLAMALRDVRDFPGLHSKISFNHRRVNSALNVLRYKGGEVKKLDEIVVQDE